MQQISLIGKVIRRPEELPGGAARRYWFVVRAENSPPEDGTPSFFDYNIVSSNYRMFGRLAVGSTVYVTGFLKLEYSGRDGTVRTRVKSSYISIVDAALNAGNVDIDMIAGSIPLDF